MLLRPDQTYVDQILNRTERVFPSNMSGSVFESQLPGAELFKDTTLDPAIGLLGDLGVATFSRAEMTNFASASQAAVYEIGTRIGVPMVSGASSAVASVYTSFGGAIETLAKYGDDPMAAAPEMAKNAAMTALGTIAAFGGFVGWAIAAIGTTAIWATSYVTSQIANSLDKNVPLPPLQTVDPSTDSWQVNRIYEVMRRGAGGSLAQVYPDGGVVPASNADYTQLFMPAYQSNQPWVIQDRGKGYAVQQGFPSEGRTPFGVMKHLFDVSEGAFGYMPGTGVMLRPLQASYRYYQATRASAGVDRYSLRCKGVNKPCYQTKKTFNGTKDCRQCVAAESVWPQEGLGWAYGGAPLNVTTPGENVGAFYPSTNRLLGWIEQQIASGGPLLYTVDTQAVYFAWRQSFELFWDFARAEWHRYRAPGWRGQVSRLATLMTAYKGTDGYELGGRNPQMPLELIANPRTDADFSISFEHSVWTRIIEPFCMKLGKLQQHRLNTIDVAYVSPGAGALYDGNGEIRKTKLGQDFIAARAALLASNKRMNVDLRLVQDLDYRQALADSGVKMSVVKLGLSGADEILAPKPARAIPHPKPSRVPPLEWAAEMSAVPRARTIPPRRVRPKVKASDDGLSGGQVTGIVLGTTAAVAGTAAYIRHRSKQKTEA